MSLNPVIRIEDIYVRRYEVTCEACGIALGQFADDAQAQAAASKHRMQHVRRESAT